VTPLSAWWLISDNTLTMSGSVVGGNISIVETARDTSSGGPALASKVTFLTPFLTQVTDHKVYTKPASVVHVTNQIALAGGPSQLTSFTQTFSQTPVPLPAAAWAGMVLIGGLGAKRTLRRRN